MRVRRPAVPHYRVPKREDERYDRSFRIEDGMNELRVRGTQEAIDFVRDIATEMTLIFGIPYDEAVGRINAVWSGQEFLTELEVATLTHEEPDIWAKRIYYEPGSMFWISEEGLKPKPYVPEGT